MTFRKTLLLGVAAAFAAVTALGFAAPAAAQEKLVVWWQKGFYKSEDDALFEAVKKFEAKTSVKVDLSLYAPQDMVPKSVAALDAGTVPDVAYGDVYDFQVASKWAFDGRLEDLSDVINPLKASFAPNTAETAFLYNDKDITLAVALGNFLAADDSPWELLMTTGLIYALPPAAIYYAFRRYMTADLTAGAVKS